MDWALGIVLGLVALWLIALAGGLWWRALTRREEMETDMTIGIGTQKEWKRTTLHLTDPVRGRRALPAQGSVPDNFGGFYVYFANGARLHIPGERIVAVEELGPDAVSLPLWSRLARRAKDAFTTATFTCQELVMGAATLMGVGLVWLVIAALIGSTFRLPGK